MDPSAILFGQDPTPRLVAMEFRDGSGISAYRREETTRADPVLPFSPFLLLDDIRHLKGWKGDCDTRRLEGEADYRLQVSVRTWNDLQSLVRRLSQTTGYTPGAFDAPFFFLNDPIHQYQLLSGRTLFKEMVFDDLRRLQLDIETYCAAGFEFPNPSREEDRVIMISLSDQSGWEKVLSGREHSEETLIREMVREIRARDPDVIEGHNIFNFDLAYLAERAQRHGVPLSLGRAGEALRSRPSRLQIAERTITYTRFEIPGRHIVDTWLLAQMYDVSSRSMESYGLKDVARHFDLAPGNRVYIEPEKINWCFDHDPERLMRYALDDVRETRAIGGILLPGYFYQAQIFPYSLQNTILRGNATKIDSLFLRGYLAAGKSIPKPPAARDFSGGYTDIFHQGVVRRVLHCDVQSLYPSIMLTYRCFPQSESLGLFGQLLNDLKIFRVRAKDRARSAGTPQEASHYQALQSTFKILINSFYGYLGFGFGHFADFEQAERITAKGRELIAGMVRWLEAKGCRVIEIDTDGIYFQPPTGMSEREEEALIENLSDTLPEGINLEMGGRYQAMFSYKMKNYALLDESDRVVIKGSGLRSRGLELFQRKFIEETIGHLLRGEAGRVRELLERYRAKLAQHRWDKKMFAKTETLKESPAVYAEKIRSKRRNPSAVYELALKSGRRYQAGDQISFYVAGEGRRVKVFESCKLASEWDPGQPDENVDYYQQKLQDLYEKFTPFLA